MDFILIMAAILKFLFVGDDPHEAVGKITSFGGGVLLGMVSWATVFDTAILTGIGAFITGVLGATINYLMKKIFERIDGKKKAK